MLPCLFAFGCQQASDADAEADGATDEGSTTSDETEAETETEAGPTETDGPPGAEDACEGLPGACAGEGVCEAYECGGRAAVFNHFGCPRVSCDADSDCPADEACFLTVYETACAPSTVDCQAADDACGCDLSNDCAGVSRAHCLPTEFYPPAEYCDVEAWSCEDLPQWIEALGSVEEELRATGRTMLAPAVLECRTAAEAEQAKCD